LSPKTLTGLEDNLATGEVLAFVENILSAGYR
jgi:hypothetical protein